jgi:hypothetical protein
VKTLVSIITGGRPGLAERPTRLHLPALAAAGLADVEWVVREDHAEAYEQDEHPLNVFPLSFADSYARAHWRHPTARFERGGFHGAFTGREWAMRSAEERGYDAVLQLDDNVVTLGLMNSNQPAYRQAMDGGTMLALLVELSASTNVMMLGAQLSSVPPSKLKTVRPGYPYSVFVERTGAGRMPYFGPYEDDIMHALEYARHGGHARTAGVVPAMTYNKEHKRKTGMRTHYDASRGLEIARRYPENVQLRVSRSTSAPHPMRDAETGQQRAVRHVLNTKGFTPVRVTDRARFLSAEQQLQAAIRDAVKRRREWDRAKMRRRGGVA